MFRLPISVAFQLIAIIQTVSSKTQALPHGIISVPLQRIKDQGAYGVELHVGNPPQSVVVLADTGSPTYAVESPSMFIPFSSESLQPPPRLLRKCISARPSAPPRIRFRTRVRFCRQFITS
jgi:hypothetical protein